jgi:hypothetical protein
MIGGSSEARPSLDHPEPNKMNTMNPAIGDDGVGTRLLLDIVVLPG